MDQSCAIDSATGDYTVTFKEAGLVPRGVMRSCRNVSNDIKSSGPKGQFIRHSEQCWTRFTSILIVVKSSILLKLT